MTDYIELRARSSFSFLEGASTPEDLAARAAELGYRALALGDRDGMYGHPRFFQGAKAAAIRPIVGAELTLADNSRLYVLAPDRARYKNLCRMITASKLRVLQSRAQRVQNNPLPPGRRHWRAGDAVLRRVGEGAGAPLPAPGHPRNLSRAPLRSALNNDPHLTSPFQGEGSDAVVRRAAERSSPDRAPVAPPFQGEGLNQGEGSEQPVYPAKGESRITLEDLERWGGGLICLAGGAMSPLARALVRGEDPRALADRLRGIFGAENFHIDLQRHLDADEERLNRKLLALAEAMRIPVAASNDVCAAGEDRRMLDVMTCIRMGTTLEEAGRALWVNSNRHLKSPAGMAALFHDLPAALAATRAIAERCEFTLSDMGYRFPDYPLPPGESADSYLRALTYAGAGERWGRGGIDARTRRQLEHELAVIARLKLAGYFLIVWDIVQFCRENRIMAQGRGSAANSAVCYALGITAVDAVKMELLFERFLSEERGEWPDIDLDLPSGDERERVIQYVYRRYGERGAAMTANVITYRTKSAVREVGKVLGFSPAQVDRLAKLNQVYEFRDHHDDLVELLRRGGIDAEAPRIAMLIDLVRRIQGAPRHLGQHSGGMVIAAQPLDEIVPLEPAAMPGRVVIQWDKDDCADLGIIKIDLLGLGMLAALEEAIPMIRTHEDVEIDLAHIPPDDPEVYAMLRRADTVGVFQVESRAQMATLPRMKPERFYDLVVEVAIIRPGPIVGKLVHPYLDRRNRRAPVTYPHPALEPILRRTLGVPLFQEQLLRIAMTVGGFTGGEAEELRRAMGFKRSAERMEKIEARLRTGMARNGIAGAAADDIVRSITSFALYGFPESHAASFALIAYASAYLKCHHPAAFFAAMLNCYPLGFYSPATLIKDAQRHAVDVLPIDVTSSDWKCVLQHRAQRVQNNPLPPGEGDAAFRRVGEGAGASPVAQSHPQNFERAPLRSALNNDPHLTSPFQGEGSDGAARRGSAALAIRMGLRYVTGLREETGRRAEFERARGRFESIADFTARVGPNRRELDALAYAGAFAAFGMTRRDAMWNAAAVERDPKSLLAGTGPRTASLPTPLPKMSPLEETSADYAATGVTAGPHLMTHLRARLTARGILSAADLMRARHDSWVKTAGVVIVRQRPGTAKGFLFITLEDETGISNLIVVPDLFQKHRALLRSAGILYAEGWLQQVDGVTAIRARKFAEINLPAAIPPSHDFH
ncbi:MAG TPA: error-prone DNA polymerase [Candidatus Binataceae bacterium]|nr:error-prone DNA polymerase [Candidatus Binataceae bacterium]